MTMAKIRTDYVTNSSSSSFVLGFKSEETMLDELKAGFPNWALDSLGIVARDAEEEDKLTAEDVLDYMKDKLWWEAKWKAKSEYERYGHDASEAWEYAESEEGKKRIAEIQEEYIEALKEDLAGKNVFVIVEYDDHCNSELEHEIMPRVKSTIRRVSHH